ncbi:MAG: hypothetical protein WCL04_10405, partial [Verrucomicrobiota bacterium]
GVSLTSPRLPPERLFRTPLLVPAGESPFLNKESDVLVTGLLALNVTVSTPILSLAGWDLSGFQLVGKHAITFTGSTRFTDLAGIDYLRVFSPEIAVPAGAVLSAEFSAGSVPTTFYLDADLDFVLADGTVRNSAGGLIIQSHSGALRFSNETLIAGNLIGAATVVPSALNLDAPFGVLTLGNSLVRTSGSGFAALASTLNISGTRFELGGNFWADATDSVQLDTLTWTGLPAGAVFQVTAGNLISARALGFDGFREINLGARTLALENVRFPAGSTVRLVSEQGRLAPLPNSGQSVQPGLVNFVRDVSYAGQPAQDFVPTAAGGTGLQPPQITVGKPGT